MCVCLCVLYVAAAPVKHQCTMCPKFFKNSEGLHGHVVAVHPKAVCSVCRQVRACLASSMCCWHPRHHPTPHPSCPITKSRDQPLLFVCAVQILPSEAARATHEATAHVVACTFCSKTFKTQAKLEAHCDAVHTKYVRPAAASSTAGGHSSFVASAL
jgi:hypothetical protein